MTVPVGWRVGCVGRRVRSRRCPGRPSRTGRRWWTGSGCWTGHGGGVEARVWDPVSGFASGHPTYAGGAGLLGSGDDQYRYSTVLSDGATRVVSEYNSTHLLVDRDVEVSTDAGAVVVREQEFTYLGTEEGGVPDPAELPDQYQRPTGTGLTFRTGPAGPGPSSEGYVFDEHGRRRAHRRGWHGHRNQLRRH